MDSKTCIIIPIKTNNKRLPGKNTYPLKGKPLFTYLFNTLKHSNRIKNVYVDSSDETILHTAKNWGFVPLKRPEEYNADDITGDELLMRIVHNIEYDIIGLLHVTTPFLKINTIESVIYQMSNDESIDSMFGITPRYSRFWFNNKPVNHDIKKLIRTQDLTPVYEEADFYFVRRNALLKYKKRVCGKIKPVEVSEIESTDIDTIVDFYKAEALLESGLATT